MLKRKILNELIFNEMKADIESGRLKPHSSILSTRQLAGKYKVSSLTVNKAVGRLVEAGLVYRVHGSGTFVSDNAAARTKKIGLAFVFPEGDRSMIDTVYGAFRNSAAELLKRRNCEITDISSPQASDPEQFERTVGGLSGLIITKWLLTDDVRRIVARHGTPMVVVQHERVLDEPLCQVVPDIKSGYAAGLAHLLETPGEEIFLAGFEDNRTRREVFLSCAAEAGSACGKLVERMSAREIGDLGRLAGMKAGKKIFDSAKKPRIFSTSDFISFGIMDAAAERGLEPGKDFRLVSYDDLEGQGILPFGEPLISSVTFPRREISLAAARLALSMREEGEKGNIHVVRIPTSLQIRKSSAIEAR